MAAAIDPEDALRTQVYRLLAGLSDQTRLDRAIGLDGDQTPLGLGLRALAREAEDAPTAAREESFELFVGIGRGELVPYASNCLTGLMNERPLARLRGEMADLWIARAAGAKKPDDHTAALCEMMAGLIDGSFGAPAGLDVQRRFFEGRFAPGRRASLPIARPRARRCCARRSGRSVASS